MTVELSSVSQRAYLPGHEIRPQRTLKVKQLVIELLEQIGG
jgi:hypothetical protein